MPEELVAPSVIAASPVRDGSVESPWLKNATPTAPAAAAFSIFCSNVQAPRWTSAMLPAGKLAKSAVSHPLVDLFPSPSCRSTAVTGAVTSPGSVWDR